MRSRISAYPESVWASILHFLVHFSDINDSSCLDIPMVLQLPENYRCSFVIRATAQRAFRKLNYKL